MPSAETRPGAPAAAAVGEALDRVLLPFSRPDFLARHWGRQFVHVPGPADRFRSLFSWGELDAIMGARPFEMDHFRLYRNGKQIDPKLYVQSATKVPRILAGSVLNLLGAGATLILDLVHSHSAAVGQLAAACEQALCAETVVNAYASCKGGPGFDLHWDPHEAIVLQVEGRKRWKVYGPTVGHPVRQDRSQVPHPQGAPVWEGVVEQGDMLYLPRGWWHVASPLDEPSLHLTVTISPPTGLDFLAWLVNELGRGETIRANVPVPGMEHERPGFLAQVQQEVSQAWSPALLEDFLGYWASRLASAQRRRQIEALRAPSSPTRVRLASVPRIVVVRDGPSAWFHANGIRWECPAGLEAALEQLRQDEALGIAGLLGPQGAALLPRLESFLGALAMAGVVLAED
jgi:hypothetical protein